METVDQYINDVIKRGDTGSELLAALCVPTLKNSPFVDVISSGMGGMAVLRIPDNYNVVVHSATGDPHKYDAKEHTVSLLDRLYGQAEQFGAEPVGLVDVIDASEGKREDVRQIGEVLVSKANEKKVAIINGELAILGARVNCIANVSGTMISMIPNNQRTGVYMRDEVPYYVFNPNGKAIWGNSDGVGTKTEFYERSLRFKKALRDSLAMKADDAVKKGADIQVVFDTVERSGDEIFTHHLDKEAARLSEAMGFCYLLVHEYVGGRLQGWQYGEPVYNVSGSAVSAIDEERLMNPPASHEGDYVLAVRGKPNPRCNGITDKRKLAVKLLGESWHETPEGEMFLEFLAEPATVFYPVFRELLNKGLATSVYHMSGGAYNGKLAKPLAKDGLYAALEGLYEPDWRELALAGFALTPAEVAYAKWPMGNEGFVTTQNPEEAIKVTESYGLQAKVVGQVEKAKNGRTGIELAGIRGSDCRNVYFSGQ